MKTGLEFGHDPARAAHFETVTRLRRTAQREVEHHKSEVDVHLRHVADGGIQWLHLEWRRSGRHRLTAGEQTTADQFRDPPSPKEAGPSVEWNVRDHWIRNPE